MPQLSVVVPVHNERDNIVPLLTEIATALRGRCAFEVGWSNRGRCRCARTAIWATT